MLHQCAQPLASCKSLPGCRRGGGCCRELLLPQGCPKGWFMKPQATVSDEEGNELISQVSSSAAEDRGQLTVTSQGCQRSSGPRWALARGTAPGSHLCHSSCFSTRSWKGSV